MEAFETSKPDRFHQSLSSAWASFLNAQHCSQEVNALRKTFDEHTQKTTLAITSIKQEAAQQHDILSTKIHTKIEEHGAHLKEALSALEEKVTGDNGITSTKFTELSEKAVAQQEGLDALRVATSRDIKTIQNQYRSALERIDLLEGELREIRAGKMASDQRLAVLERQFNTADQTHQELSEDMINLLGQILSRRDELIRLLDTQTSDKHLQNSPAISGPTGSSFSQEPLLPGRPISQQQLQSPTLGTRQDENNHAVAQTRRELEEPLQPPAKRSAQSHGIPAHDVPSDNPNQDIRSLYLVFHDRHKTKPPKSDTAFIWEFLSSIEDPIMSKHIQESLAAILPEYVTASRDTRRRNPRKHVDISRGLTWRKFREALIKIPGPPSS